MRTRRAYIFLKFLLGLWLQVVWGQVKLSEPASLYYPGLARQLAFDPTFSLLWRGSTQEAIAFRSSVVDWIDSLNAIQLIERPYHVAMLRRLQVEKGPSRWMFDHDSSHLVGLYFLDALLAASFDLYRGGEGGSFVGYDVISRSYRHQDDSVILSGIVKARHLEQLRRWFFSLEPNRPTYLLLRSAMLSRLKKLQKSRSSLVVDDTLVKLKHSLRQQRWLTHFGLDRYLVVNVAAAEASYVVNGETSITMRAIVGKPATPTPRFASYCKQLILYPYWYVPASIAIGEYLSKIKKDPRWLDHRNMQVIDPKGRVVDHHQLNWGSFSARYFPYIIRQSTGCDNALGVLKFDLETPYGVYLHDTNHKTAFLQPSRFLSHGCIRLEEPLLLGSRLLPEGLDTAYLQSCFADKKPIVRPLPAPLPVFCLISGGT
jgi:L,D-transpeptidase YcbB